MIKTNHLEMRMASRNYTEPMIDVIWQYGKVGKKSRIVLDEQRLLKAIDDGVKEKNWLCESLKVAKSEREFEYEDIVQLRRVCKKINHKLKAMKQLLKKVPAVLIAKGDVLVTVYQIGKTN